MRSSVVINMFQIEIMLNEIPTCQLIILHTIHKIINLMLIIKINQKYKQILMVRLAT